ncbi:hypothetical protein HDU97_004509 [Phlyctochytrium planicorne]|nr:hypothetical protein HDU97_004509 [Phlyctochytrium planicorne]
MVLIFFSSALMAMIIFRFTNPYVVICWNAILLTAQSVGVWSFQKVRFEQASSEDMQRGANIVSATTITIMSGYFRILQCLRSKELLPRYIAFRLARLQMEKVNPISELPLYSTETFQNTQLKNGNLMIPVEGRELVRKPTFTKRVETVIIRPLEQRLAVATKRSESAISFDSFRNSQPHAEHIGLLDLRCTLC